MNPIGGIKEIMENRLHPARVGHDWPAKANAPSISWKCPRSSFLTDLMTPAWLPELSPPRMEKEEEMVFHFSRA